MTTIRGTLQSPIASAILLDGPLLGLKVVASFTLISSGTTVEMSIGGEVVRRISGSSYLGNWKVIPFGKRAVSQPVNFLSSNQAVATVDSEGVVTRVSDGLVTITAFTATGYSASAQIDTSVFAGGDFDTFLGFLPNSLGFALRDAVLGRLNTSGEKELYSSYGTEMGGFVRNVNCYLYRQHGGHTLNLSCISPWNSTGGRDRAGTTITDSHILFAAHYPIAIGATVTFVTMENTIINRTILSVSGVSGTDGMVARLNSPLPPSVSVAKFFPSDLHNYFSPYSSFVDSPLGTHYCKLIGVVIDNTETVGLWPGVSVNYADYRFPPVGFESYVIPITVGDSGSPVLFFVGDQVIIGTTLSLATSGPDFHLKTPEINAAILNCDLQVGQASGKTCTIADLSGFPTFN